MVIEDLKLWYSMEAADICLLKALIKTYYPSDSIQVKSRSYTILNCQSDQLRHYTA